MNEVNNDSPDDADRFRKAAVGHANAAIIVHKHLQRTNTVREDSTWVSLQNLIGLAAECAFKSYLVSHNTPIAALRRHDVGHNLVHLHQMCIDIGLREDQCLVGQYALSVVLGEVAEKLGKNHGDYSYRYIEGDRLKLLHQDLATDTALAAIHCLTDIVQLRIGEKG